MVEADRLDIKDKSPLVLAEVLFDANALQQITQYTNLLKRVCTSNYSNSKSIFYFVSTLCNYIIYHFIICSFLIFHTYLVNFNCLNIDIFIVYLFNREHLMLFLNDLIIPTPTHSLRMTTSERRSTCWQALSSWWAQCTGRPWCPR